MKVGFEKNNFLKFSLLSNIFIISYVVINFNMCLSVFFSIHKILYQKKNKKKYTNLSKNILIYNSINRKFIKVQSLN